ncbi:hypothetical protein CEXT_122741 [Caerostris extrusa]|uniref:Uncharacterized protein n=1 Tax=Caerostris extrusa TaxID=172846 RepID=A0AAV4V0M0_CAEEX|nr:hypothetical protein CEXT_122741 [Caerostris extrusa]
MNKSRKSRPQAQSTAALNCNNKNRERRIVTRDYSAHVPHSKDPSLIQRQSHELDWGTYTNIWTSACKSVNYNENIVLEGVGRDKEDEGC